MKAVAYNIKSFERECLATANHKKHDITLISNPLSLETVLYAEGKEAVIVSGDDVVSAKIIKQLAVLGIRYLVTRSIVTNHIDKKAATKNGLLVVSIPSSYTGSMESLQDLAEHTINNLDIFTH
jgi:lactate dehydrogenase-like 2-hydroxyacid dehydrogenase